MLPGNGSLSAKAVVAGSVDPVKRPGDFLIDYERGGVALNNPSQGLMVQMWKLHVDRDNLVTGKWNFYVDSPVNGTEYLFSANGVTEASLAFDQNMRPFVVYVESGVTRIWWYDPAVPGVVVTTLGSGFRSPRCCTDEKREWHTSNSDIQLWYVRGLNLCLRYQRERFTVEHVMKVVGPQAELVSVTMATNNRLRLRLRNTNVSINDQQAKIETYPLLSDIVLDLCSRAGIPAENLDVNDLYGEFIVGYPVISDDDVASQLEPLSQAFFFDPTEFDKKLRFLRRGRDVVGRFTYRDLVDRDPGAFKQTVVQEDKLPKTVEVSHLDPAGAFSRNTQRANRKSNMVKAKGNDEVDLPFSATADQAATIALKRIKMVWHEPVTYEFWLPISFTEWVQADSVEYLDEENNVYRLRLETRNEDSGVLKFTAKKDGGRAVYGTQALGLSLPPPLSTTPGLIGETRLEILNIPALREQDDELGVYVAVAGDSSAWYGADISVSSDGGLTYTDVARMEVPATLGETTTVLLDEVSAEYPADQSVNVLVNYELSSVSFDAVLGNANRCVIGDEIIQFQFAVLVGIVDDRNHYRLSGLVRGRYATPVEVWPVDTRFVLLDTSAMFMRAQQWMLGRELYIKPVSLGLTEDETASTAYDYDEGVSLREFPVDQVEAVRAGSDVTVSFIGRGRLGIDSAPANGKYFAGYRVKFSDGHIIDTSSMAATYNGAPVGVNVQVCALSSVVGEGPYSTPITV